MSRKVVINVGSKTRTIKTSTTVPQVSAAAVAQALGAVPVGKRAKIESGHAVRHPANQGVLAPFARKKKGR